MSRTSTDLRQEILTYFKTLPEITSCEILILRNYIYIESINNSSLTITPNVNYFSNNQSNEHYANLVQAGIKQCVALDISKFLLKILTIDTFPNCYNSIINLQLTELCLNYPLEENQ